jgi:hypothetical protein
MTGPSPDQPPFSEPDADRSGADVAEAIEVAERDSALDDLHTDAQGTTSGEAPVERAAGDPDMTEGQVVYGPDDSAEDDAGHDRPETESAGAAQAVRGARASDLRASGEQSS